MNMNLRRIHPFFSRQNLILVVGITLIAAFIIPFPFCPDRFPHLDGALNDLYTMEANSCRFIKPGGLNIFCIIGVLVLLPPSLIFLATVMISRDVSRASRLFRQSLQSLLWFFLIVLTVVQVKTQFRQFVFEYVHFENRTLDQRQALLFPETFGFARYCRSHVPGPARGKLVTDLDIHDGQGLFDTVDLTYLLYPLDIVTDYPDPQELVIFGKNDPSGAVPPGFIGYPLYDWQSLIAVKKDGM